MTVDRLQQLLTRVQENRAVPRERTGNLPPSAAAVAVAPAPAPAPAPTPIAKPASVAAAPPTRPAAAPARMSQPVIAEERVNLPQGRNMSAPGAQPQRAAEPARMSREPQPPARSNPRERDRVATPLEMAVEGELNRAPSEPPTAQFGSQSGSQSGSKGAKQSPASMGALAPDAPLGMDDLQASYSVEAEPIRELTRPIAQTVSKHAPEVDATFGAMLRRSLSLRPR